MHMALRRLPLTERLSIPAPSRTLLANTRRWAEPILLAHRTLIEGLENQIGIDLCASEYNENYSFLKYAESHKPDHRQILNLCSAALILNWVVGRASKALPESASLYDAENWYKEGNSSFYIAKLLNAQTLSKVLEPLRALDYGLRFLDILPYATEVFETSDEILRAFGPSRKTKRAAGIFYTPSDVSDYIVNFVYSLRPDSPKDDTLYTWLDPACGTGCFLISALYRQAEEQNAIRDEAALAYIEKCLYGIDISPLALQSAAYALVLVCDQGELLKKVSLQKVLQRIGKNLVVCNAMFLKDHKVLSTLVPDLASGVDFIVSNPPYAKRSINHKQVQPDLFIEAAASDTRGENLYTSFVRMLPSLSKLSTGAGGMVVPLSIAYNTRKEFQRLRQLIRSRDKWWLAHFDRTPDSLFGDDVKTRNTIVFFNRESGRKATYTSNLIRWSSRSRMQLFNSVTFSEIPSSLHSDAIPKIGDELGQELLSQLVRKNMVKLGQAMRRATRCVEHPHRLLRNAGTAYNWLPFEIVSTIDEKIVTGGEEKYTYWLAQPADEIGVVFALVQSRVAYWLWRVWGDGFHLNENFTTSLPFSPYGFPTEARNRLRMLGESLWEEMLENKTVTSNAGVTSISYCPYISESLLDQIDSLIIYECQLPREAPSYLRNFVKQTIVAGREDEITSNPALHWWLKKEKKNEHHLVRD